MSFVLIDSSVWIDYFRGTQASEISLLNELIDNNQICVNELILAEILPIIYHKKEKELIDVLNSVRKIELDINWPEIVDYQRKNLKNGINNVGIADLIIVQNVVHNQLILHSLDKHFHLMSKIHKYRMY